MDEAGLNVAATIRPVGWPVQSSITLTLRRFTRSDPWTPLHGMIAAPHIEFIVSFDVVGVYPMNESIRPVNQDFQDSHKLIEALAPPAVAPSVRSA